MVRANHLETVVQVKGFGKRYKKHVAVRSVDLAVRRGEIYGLIGPDGAGKSSLMKAIAGVLSYEEGQVQVFGITIDSERAAERVKGRMGFLPQGLGQNLYPELSIEENVDFFARLRLVSERDLAERKQRLLALTRLERFRDRAMKNLSGGMKQKLGLVCTLIHQPELVILDEPTTGVDPVSRRDFWSILGELLRERGMTALVSTAYMDEAARFHRLSFLSHGAVIASGTPAEVQALVPGTVVTFEASPQLEALTRLKKSFKQVETLGPLLHVFAEETDPDCAMQCVQTSLSEMHANNVETDDPQLEDVFVALLLQQNALQPAQQSAATKVERPLFHEPAHGPVASVGPNGQDGPAFRDSLAIEAKDLVRDFDSFRAVDRVSFQVKQGEIFGLLGANGAGKTTVIKMLTGILPPSAGAGRVAGADMGRAAGAIKERIGYMSQAFSLYVDLTVLDNIRLFAGIYGLGKRETFRRVQELLDLAGLRGYETDLVGGLPMGVRQRLALGCALVHRPRVLFLDEPTSGVDPIGRRKFWDILSRLSREEGVALLITTHYLSEAEHCDHLALMHGGRVVSEGSPADMKRAVESEVGNMLEIVTNQPGPALTQLERMGFPDVSLFGTRLHLLSARPDWDEVRIMQALASSGLTVRAIRRRPLSLEDVFVYRIMALERRGRPDSLEVQV